MTELKKFKIICSKCGNNAELDFNIYDEGEYGTSYDLSLDCTKCDNSEYF